MLLTIVTEDGELRSMELDEKTEVETLRDLVEIEAAIPAGEQTLLHEGKPITSGTLESNNIKDQDMVYVVNKKHQRNHQQAAAGPALTPAQGKSILERIRTDPTLQQLTRNHPELARAVAAENASEAVSILQALMEGTHSRSLNFPGAEMSAEAQKLIEERIQQENIERNLSDAFEYNPEAFAKVVMLFVRIEVNGEHATAFVDTGAESTIISLACARRLKIDRLMDKRFQGVARGVGSAKILGRIHSTVMNIGGEFVQCTLTVLEDMNLDIIMGLDLLRKNAVTIDLGADCLRIHDKAIRFLAEKDIPRHMLTLSEAVKKEDFSSSQTDRTKNGSGRPTVSPAATTTAAAVKTSSGARPVESTVPLPEGGATGVPPEEKIRRLMSVHGVQRDVVVQALQAANGNEEIAANILAQSAYGF